MVCISSDCLKTYIKFSGIIIALIGLGVGIFCIITITDETEIDEANDLLKIRNYFFIILLVLALIFFVIGLLGTHI
jgi:uncharacterized membrane protein YbhN (UPF0104 family)